MKPFKWPFMFEQRDKNKTVIKMKRLLKVFFFVVRSFTSRWEDKMVRHHETCEASIWSFLFRGYRDFANCSTYVDIIHGHFKDVKWSSQCPSCHLMPSFPQVKTEVLLMWENLIIIQATLVVPIAFPLVDIVRPAHSTMVMHHKTWSV